MRFAELICRVAEERFRGAAQLGVRLSPVELSVDEARELLAQATQRMRTGVRVAVAVPGAPLEETPTSVLAPGERAAERATHWRNAIDPDAGERVLYVSVREQRKAGGLRDTLDAVTESDLRASFSAWCGSGPPELPASLGPALVESGVLSSVAARELCEFAAAVAEASDASRWRVAAHSLPLLSLVVDRRLSDAPATRLRANAELVQATTALDTRRQNRLPTGAKRASTQLSAAISTGGEIRAALSQVDLGSATTTALRSKPKKPKKPKGLKKAQRSKKPTQRKKPAAKRPARKDGREGGALPDGGSSAGSPTSSGLTPLGDSEAQVGAESVGLAESRVPYNLAATDGEWPCGVGEGGGGAQPGIGALLRARGYRGGPSRLAAGTEHLLLKSLELGAAALLWEVPSGPLRPLLAKLPKQHSQPEIAELCELSGAAPAAELKSWKEARSALASLLLQPHGRSSRLAKLVHRPLLVLSDPEVLPLATALVAAQEAVLTRVAALRNPTVALQTLSLDTVTLRGERDESELMLVSPLHPLVLGQQVQTLRLVEQLSHVSPLEGRVLSGAAALPAVAPSHWPRLLSTGTSDELTRSSSEHGLVTYSRVPGLAPKRELQLLGEDLLALALRCCPGAHNGLAVSVAGPGAGIVAGSMARATEELDDPRLSRIVLYLDDLSVAELAADLPGSVQLRALPVGEDSRAELGVHVRLRIQPPAAQTQARQDADLGIVDGSSTPKTWLRRRVRTVGDTLITSVNFAGVPGAEGVAKLWSVIEERERSASLTYREHAEPLSSLVEPIACDPSTLDVVVASLVGRTPPTGVHLLMHQQRGPMQVAVVTRDVRTPGAVMRPGYRELGVTDLRTRRVRHLTRALLRKSSSGVLSMDGGSSVPLRDALLEAVLRSSVDSAEVAVARLDPSDLARLGAGSSGLPEGVGLTLAAAVHAGQLQLALGVGSGPLPMPLTVDGRTLTGDLSGLLLSVVRGLEVAGAHESPACPLVRDLLGDLLQRAALGTSSVGAPLGRLLETTEIDLSTRVILTVAPESELADQPEPPRLRGWGPVMVKVIDHRLLSQLVMER